MGAGPDAGERGTGLGTTEASARSWLQARRRLSLSGGWHLFSTASSCGSGSCGGLPLHQPRSSGQRGPLHSCLQIRALGAISMRSYAGSMEGFLASPLGVSPRSEPASLPADSPSRYVPEQLQYPHPHTPCSGTTTRCNAAHVRVPDADAEGHAAREQQLARAVIGRQPAARTARSGLVPACGDGPGLPPTILRPTCGVYFGTSSAPESGCTLGGHG